jgi:multidrug efflux pump
LKLAEFCVEKPVFATVLNLIILLVGILCLTLLNVRYQPKVFKPGLTVVTNYPGASAQVVEKSVTDVLEDSLAGIANLDVMNSRTKNSMSFIKLKFKELDQTQFVTAQSAVIRAISSVSRKLPENVTPTIRTGSDENQILFYGFSSNRMNTREITDYLQNNVNNLISKIPGVGEVTIMGPQSALVIAVDPNKLAHYNLTFPQLITVLQTSNKSLSLGNIVNKDQSIIINANTDIGHISELQTLVIATRDSQLIRLSQVAKVSIGDKDPTEVDVLINGSPGVGLNISATDDANPIEVGKLVQKTLKKMKKTFPLGLKMTNFMDMPKIMERSLSEVGFTIIEAIVLVCLVTLLFLGNLRLSYVPMVTIPICLLGSCIFLFALGYTLNTFTLLAIVLAVGLVVDDAIVVLENIYRYLSGSSNMTSKEAAKKGSTEIAFAVVGMTICLIAVYLPVVLLKSHTAVYFQAFALTLASCVLISGFTSLTLSPVMCRFFLKSKTKDSNQENKYQIFLEKVTNKAQDYYKNLLDKVLKLRFLVLGVFVLLVVFGVWLFESLPSNLMPNDQAGIGMFVLTGAPTASPEWLNNEFKGVSKQIEEIDGVKGVLGSANNCTNDSSNCVFGIFKLTEKGLNDTSFANNIVAKINKIMKSNITLNGSASLLNLNEGLNNDNKSGGLSLMLLGVMSYEQLEKVSNNLKEAMNKMPEIVSEHISFDRQQVYDLTVDRTLANQLAVPVDNIFTSLQAAYGGQQLSNEYRYGADSYPIIIRLPTTDLKDFSSLSNIYVKRYSASSGEFGDSDTSATSLLPLSDFVKVKASMMRPYRNHFNQMRATGFSRVVAPGYTLGQAVSAVNAVAAKILPAGVQLQFSGSARQLQKNHGELSLIFIMGIVFIYLVLAALFESFIDPLIILLTVPLCIVGALFALFIVGGSINLFTGIGLLTLIGLVSKHGILITQFANQKLTEGLSKKDAILQAASTRLRPIIMTSLTMILGAIPLIVQTGAGSNSRSQLGWVIVAGLVIGTFFSLFVVPVAYDFLSRRKT